MHIAQFVVVHVALKVVRLFAVFNMREDTFVVHHHTRIPLHTALQLQHYVMQAQYRSEDQREVLLSALN